MSYSNCKYLDVSKKKEGKISGCVYYCRLNKMYLTADTIACDNLDKAYRSVLQQEQLEKEGKEYYDRKISIGFYLLFTLSLILLGLIMGVFKIQ